MPDWRELPPESLILNPTLTSGIPAHQMAGEAMGYARRAAHGASYDELAFRVYAAAPKRGPVPIQTIPGIQLARRTEDAARTPREVQELMRQEALLAHRSIEVPLDGHWSYTVDPRLIHFRRPRPGAKLASDQEVWTFSLNAPPESLLSLCVPADEPRIAAHQFQLDFPGVFWIPLPLLIETGRFVRMQDWREHLSTHTAPPNFYCFISHRWLTPWHPDPEAVQAALIAWQLVGHMCEAVRVAQRRGLMEPRKLFQGVGFTVGIQGSKLAEALIVNVLRQGLDSNLLDAAFEEAASLESVADYGIAAAHEDAGLERLRALLDGLPALSLAERIFVWYDFGSMPQTPRTEEEDVIFRDGLKHLNAIQLLGRTAILLDEAEDYLSRAWCTLEAVVADTAVGVSDLLVGSRRVTTDEGSVEHDFDNLLEDRPHLIWRAVLDTEVFHVQTQAQCLSRLSLAVTDPTDIPFIYQELARLGAPRKVHIDDSEIVTGVLALPVVDGAVLIPKSTSRPAEAGRPSAEARGDLDWSDLLAAPQDGDPGGRTAAFTAWAAPLAGQASCHIAVVASCEGEAVLITRRIVSRRGELESVLNARVVSVSWLASDIAPVGQMVDGGLRARAVDAHVWAVAATEARLLHCTTTGALLTAIRASGLAGYEVMIDRASANVREVLRAPRGEVARLLAQEIAESVQPVPVEQARLPSIAGGVFRSDLLRVLAETGS
jgi:hypothetical protein